MFCPRCGKENADGAQFCVHCGIELSAGVGTTPASAPAYSGPSANSGKAIASLICGIFFFIFPAAIAAIVLGHLSLSDIRKSAGRLKGSGLATAGLVLGYGGVVMIPLILIVAAIAIPNLLRAKIATNEAYAMASLREIATAAITYSSTYGNGFPPSLGAMGGPAGATTPSCENALMLDAVLSADGVDNTSQKRGYVFTYLPGQPLAAGSRPTICSGPGVESYAAIAVPVTPGSTGVRGFYIDQSGVIRYSTDGSPPNQNSPPLE